MTEVEEEPVVEAEASVAEAAEPVTEVAPAEEVETETASDDEEKDQ